MTDTQWPLYEVFIQQQPGQPHRNAGSVHAPDAELALQNARDVFVRRPDCSSLWVVPESAIRSRTAEQLAGEPAAAVNSDAAPNEDYEVFQKHSQRQSEAYVIHLGRVTAASPDSALQQARIAFGDAPAFVWWVIPSRAITCSDAADAPSWFDPAGEKTYRHPSDYPVLTQMRAVKSVTAQGELAEQP
jgi:ring-1,2-phenylacetyl-CoA epoxidase subunit PaaB